MSLQSRMARGVICALGLALMSALGAHAQVGMPAALLKDQRLRIEIATATAHALSDVPMNSTSAIGRLERWAQQYRSDRMRLPGGRWALSVYYHSLSEITPRVAAQWLAQFPDSPAAKLAMIIARLGDAAQGQLHAMYSEAHPQSYLPEYDQLRAIYADLQRIKSAAALDPHWYVLAIETGTLLGIEADEMVGLVEEALDREPTYGAVYDAAAAYFLPRWHGNGGMFEAFAQTVARKTAHVDGGAAYAQVYLAAFTIEYGLALFRRSDVNWDRLRQAIEVNIAKYPTRENLFGFALLACLAGDNSMTRRIYERMGITRDDGAFKFDESHRTCFNWAITERSDKPLEFRH